MGSTFSDPYLVPGFSLLRLLSEREGSKVYLARDTSDALCAMKLKLPHDPAGLAEFAGETLALASWTLSGGTLLLRCCEGVASGLFPWLSLVQPLYLNPA